MNPFNSLNMKNPMNMSNMNYFRGIYQMLANSGSPQQVFDNVVKNNPNMKPIVDLMNKGANPKDIFEDMCRQRGIDPQEFIKGITR